MVRRRRKVSERLRQALAEARSVAERFGFRVISVSLRKGALRVRKEGTRSEWIVFVVPFGKEWSWSWIPAV